MLRTNKVRLLTDQEGYLSLINETFFFDHASAFESLAKTVTRRREDITQELCTMPDTIFFGDANYALGNIWWTKSPCFLERIPIDPVYSAPLAVAFDKRVFKDYDLVNSMIMRVFNPDQMEKFWAPRYGARGPERPPTPKRQLRPLSMLLLEPAFVILSIGMLSSFTLLLCPSTLAEERLYNPFLRTSDCSLLRALH
uniref:Uncharacterized protein n=1 Tax=Plectus sambesii TaxID=2011161 RepID=A0A914V310_9BILA